MLHDIRDVLASSPNHVCITVGGEWVFAMFL